MPLLVGLKHKIYLDNNQKAIHQWLLLITRKKWLSLFLKYELKALYLHFLVKVIYYKVCFAHGPIRYVTGSLTSQVWQKIWCYFNVKKKIFKFL